MTPDQLLAIKLVCVLFVALGCVYTLSRGA